MKSLKILTLASTLALGVALSAQTQSTTESDQYTTQSNQYTTQSTDQTMSTPAAPDNDMQSSTSTYTNSDPANDWNATNDGSNNRHISDRLMDIQNDSGGN